MKSIKQVLTMILAVVAFASTASAYTVSITDTFIGGNPGGGTNTNTSWDGKDVVGDANIFGIDSMNVVFNNGNLSSISIFTNYVINNSNLGQYGTNLGDLFISTNGYITPTKFDTNTTGEQWEYALVLQGANAHSSSLTLANASGSLALYQVNSNILLSLATSGTYRNNQEVMIDTTKGNLVNANVGNWSVSGNELKFALTTLPNVLDVSDYGFHWGMSCGNDVIEGGATAPVPEPGTLMLLGSGMLGLAVFGKRRMNKQA